MAAAEAEGKPDECENVSHRNCGAYLSSPSVASAVAFVAVAVVAVACMQNSRQSRGGRVAQSYRPIVCCHFFVCVL